MVLHEGGAISEFESMPLKRQSGFFHILCGDCIKQIGLSNKMIVFYLCLENLIATFGVKLWAQHWNQNLKSF